ncbi:GNAT family N-acetyltransferase [Pradoshia sp.]|uniref:GNAT family N-acetyltransferase n=1 Tax=Pradoshia sp. TaxID=2651281 RepID=UPI003F11CA3E
MDIEWKELDLHDSDSLLNEALHLYDESFPEEVRESHDLFRRSLTLSSSENVYHFLVGLENGKVISMATAHYFARANFGYIVYLAAHPEKRGIGLGKKTIEEMRRRLQLDAKASGYPSLSAVVLETEKETTAHDEEEYAINLKRLKFFESLGFQIAEVEYVQPPLFHGQIPVPLYLQMNILDETASLTPEDTIEVLYKEKYNKVNQISSKELELCLQP